MFKKPKELSVGQVWEDEPFLLHSYKKQARIYAISWIPGRGGYIVAYSVRSSDGRQWNEENEISTFHSKYSKYVGMFYELEED